ncbi:MAG: acetyl ornithine aminotransferase family protein [Anaerolineales bacterium]
MSTPVKTRVLKLPVPGPKARALLERDARNVSPSYTRSYPFVMERGQGTEVWDVDGYRYLDFNAGIAVNATGHSHPDVVRAIQEQAAKFIHMSGTDFYYPVQIELAEKLNALAPGSEPKRLFFTNSGTESIEAALKLARYYTRRPRMIAFIGAFHGRSMGSLSLNGSKALHKAGFAPLVPEVTHTHYAYCYRCPMGKTYGKCRIDCVRYLEDVIFQRLVPPEEVAAIFVEPIQGEGGYIVPPPEFLPMLREIADKYGILLVADEIQTGFGRTGKMFAIEHWGVAPDILAVAKGIASGMPLGAMIARESLMTWKPGSHGNTFGGNPVSCAAALETIRLIENGYMQNAAVMGQRMLEILEERRHKHPSIGDIRGKGLMVGVELVKNQETKEMAPKLRDDVVMKAFEHGLLILGCGPNTVRFMPPLNITKEHLEEGLDIFDHVLTLAEREAGLVS